jgi:hypothetical protein
MKYRMCNLTWSKKLEEDLIPSTLFCHRCTGRKKSYKVKLLLQEKALVTILSQLLKFQGWKEFFNTHAEWKECRLIYNTCNL